VTCMSNLLRKFPTEDSPPTVLRGDGPYLELEDGRRVLDTTAGWTSYAVLGYRHPEVIDAMKRQMELFCHIDYNAWNNPMLEELAEVLLSRAPQGLDRVYFSGNSGSEAMEAAMKLSFQSHFDAGNTKKTWFLSRDQSFHGATLHGISISELPILEFYNGILPPNRARISQHHPLYFQKANESLDGYARRCAKELEDKILEVGSENVCAFIGETQLGSLVGDVPPAPNYWKYMREVCDRHNVHLILDEIYCGLGRSGRVYSCDWDGVTPDFICVGKNLGAGFVPLSAVITQSRFEKIIADGQGRIQHGHTHQGHSLGTAAALATQKIVQTDDMLGHIYQSGKYMREVLLSQLGDHPFFRDIRGRGLLFSFEYDCPNKPSFGLSLANVMNQEHDILINAKWHRVSFTPAYILTREEIDRVLDQFISTFKSVAAEWDSKKGSTL
jgi:adenosylmethionine-8-amino-7-oxononanoate aminotransferase